MAAFLASVTFCNTILLVLSIQQCMASGLAKNLKAKKLSIRKAVTIFGFHKSITREARREKGGFLMNLCIGIKFC